MLSRVMSWKTYLISALKRFSFQYINYPFRVIGLLKDNAVQGLITEGSTAKPWEG